MRVWREGGVRWSQLIIVLKGEFLESMFGDLIGEVGNCLKNNQENGKMIQVLENKTRKKGKQDSYSFSWREVQMANEYILWVYEEHFIRRWWAICIIYKTKENRLGLKYKGFV